MLLLGDGNGVLAALLALRETLEGVPNASRPSLALSVSLPDWTRSPLRSKPVVR